MKSTLEETALTPDNRAAEGRPPPALFGIDDARLTILRQAPSETLVALIGEIVSPKLGCSLAFFAIGASKEFRETEPPVFLELVFQVLRERVPNVV